MKSAGSGTLERIAHRPPLLLALSPIIFCIRNKECYNTVMDVEALKQIIARYEQVLLTREPGLISCTFDGRTVMYSDIESQYEKLVRMLASKEGSQGGGTMKPITFPNSR